MRTHPQHRLILAALAPSVLATLTLLTAVPLFADEPGNAAGIMAMGAIFLFMFVVFVAFYIYGALATQTIARKTNTENGWMAWIPIANLILMANIARKPVWWGLLCMVPLVGLVFMILLWMAIAEARNKPNWWGILLIVPVVQFIVPGYLAWSD
jgi:sterol desaturase/sphingolipid hydroxylase (fatty acid hydroxylase superfamily)